MTAKQNDNYDLYFTTTVHMDHFLQTLKHQRIEASLSIMNQSVCRYIYEDIYPPAKVIIFEQAILCGNLIIGKS